jgi:hypothetical protein
MVLTLHYAPWVVLIFLGSCFVLGVAGLGFIAALGARRRNLATGIFIVAALYVALYGGILFTFSASSEEQVLAAGQTKYFCEIDCHVAYSVTSVTVAKMLGEGSTAATASGQFYVVNVRSWFDEKTISARRPKDAPLWPNPRIVYALDDAGQRHYASFEGQKAILGSTVPLTQQLKPGESYETIFVFDLPQGTSHARLLVSDSFLLDAFLIGHENSLGHKKAYFALEPTSRAEL